MLCLLNFFFENGGMDDDFELVGDNVSLTDSRDNYCGTEVVEVEFYEDWAEQFVEKLNDEPSLLPATGMVGLVFPEGMSSNQAHKIFNQVTTINDPNDRLCTCGSSQAWVNCSSGSNYCG
jgi:hypothetical protein